MTFVSADVCSLTQTIPLEILAEPLKARAEPLLKSTTEPSPATEKKPEEKESAPAPSTSDNQGQSPVKPKEETSSPVVEAEKQEKKSPEIKLESPPVADKPAVDDDLVEESDFKKSQSYLHPKTGTNLSATHGSTSSLDKDRMSIDSLDISNDRRHQSTNNIHDQ